MQPVHPESLAKAAVALLTTTAGAVFMQVLLMSSANSMTAARACDDVLTALRPRVALLVAEWCAAQAVQPLHPASLVEEAMAYLCDAIWQCRSRSTIDFSVWVRTRVVAWLDSEIDLNESSAKPNQHQLNAGAPPESEQFLLAAPRRERAAVIYAARQRLTPAERKVIELRQQPRATWETVARALRVSVTTAKARHADALNRAQLAALDVLADRLDATPDEVYGLRDDSEIHEAA